MALHDFYCTFRSLFRRYHHHHRRYHSLNSSLRHTSHNVTGFLYYLTHNKPLSTSAESVVPPELSGKNAYDLLGVSDSSSFAEIKASFRKLAKETHPDLSQSPDGFNSHRFIQILAAYEILSDTEKRAHYDRYLLSQKVIIQKHSKQGYSMYTNEATEKEMEVVEWLKWYRYAINEIISEKRIMNETSSYFDALENDFYSAINAAYYGPIIQSMDFLPDCFEADVRSVPQTHEILHLVSGRDLFGKVCITKKFLELPDKSLSLEINYTNHDSNTHTCDAYKDLELHVSGKVVAVANRVPQNEDCEDHINVYLNLHEDEENAVECRMFLGSIIGLGTRGEEGSCFVHDNCGVKTHVIMIHRTLLVKHMHWYQLGDKASVCECRCTRARLPPSKYWLFEPRCGLHDIGGWYVETYGRDNKGKTVPCQRYWDGVDFSQPYERRVHPAIYLIALAYRTLDIEDEMSKKQTVRDIIHGKMSQLYKWCKNITF